LENLHGLQVMVPILGKKILSGDGRDQAQYFSVVAI